MLKLAFMISDLLLSSGIFFSQSSGIFLTTKIELLGASNICSGEEVMARKGQEEVGTVQRAAYCGGQVKLPQLSQPGWVLH